MTDPGRIREGTLLWTPSAEFAAGSNLTDYLGWLERERGLRFADYGALWRWSRCDQAGQWWSQLG